MVTIAAATPRSLIHPFTGSSFLGERTQRGYDHATWFPDASR